MKTIIPIVLVLLSICAIGKWLTPTCAPGEVMLSRELVCVQGHR